MTAGKLFGMSHADRLISFEETKGIPTKTAYIGWVEAQGRKQPVAPANGDETLRPDQMMIETELEATAANVTGKPDGVKGVLANVAIHDKWLMKLHTYMVRISGKDGHIGNGTIQVPEVITTSVDGDWTIPSKGVLLIGLGIHSAEGTKTDNTILRERVIVIDANDLDESVFENNRSASSTRLTPGAAPTTPLSIAMWVIISVLALLSLGVIGWSLRRGEAGE